jgi:deoxyribonuclease-4
LRLGFHVRTSGGLVRAAQEAVRLGCETIQIWSGNPRGWRRPAIDPAEARRFRGMLAEAAIHPVFVHVPYLANVAADDAALWERSRDLLATDLERTSAVGDCLVVHMGSSRAPAAEVERRVAAALGYALEAVPEGRIIVENMAGQGAQVGWDLAQVARVIDRVGERLGSFERTGVCLDVSHAFQAGYHIATASGIDEVLALLEQGGPGRVRLIHLNDSRTARGSRVDRHWHIGQGEIGEAGMRALLTHPLLAEVPAVMETPKDAPDADARNMAAARRLAGGGH